MYLFSGRGGVSMAPIEEHGALWSYDPSGPKWRRIKPADTPAPYPSARSYHAMATDGKETLYVHAGCPESGRLCGPLEHLNIYIEDVDGACVRTWSSAWWHFYCILQWHWEAVSFERL